MPTTQHLHSIRRFHLVTQNLPRLIRFYSDVLGFVAEDSESIPPDELRLLAVKGDGRRQALSIGAQTVAIDQFETAGRPYPANSNAAALSFQHLALVVIDIAEAHARLRDMAPISLDGPQQLPASSGSVRAFKFRDPDGHPLELLQFPQNDVPVMWEGRKTPDGQIALGIDHSAISVRDVELSTAFFSSLGLKAGKGTLNEGRTQERLDDLPNVEVLVRPMVPEGHAPHLELLCYKVPRGQPGAALRANDVAATRIVWRGRQSELLRDPDGHLHQVEL